MKLRLDKKTVRIRLSKEEILSLQSDGFLEENITLSEDNFFSYVIDVLEDIDECGLYFGEDGMRVEIPFQNIREVDQFESGRNKGNFRNR
jgi:hypothetical protein